MKKAVSIVLMVILGIILVMGVSLFTISSSASKNFEKDNLKQGFIIFFDRQISTEAGENLDNFTFTLLRDCENRTSLDLNLDTENVTVLCQDLREKNLSEVIGGAAFDQMYERKYNCTWEFWHCLEGNDVKFFLSGQFQNDLKKFANIFLIASLVAIVLIFLVKKSLKSFFAETGLCLIIGALIVWISAHVLYQQIQLQKEMFVLFYSSVVCLAIGIAIAGLILFILSFFIKNKMQIKPISGRIKSKKKR